MRINDDNDINHTDTAKVIGISLMAALRGGNLTYRQKKRLDRIADQAAQREAKKRNSL